MNSQILENSTYTNLVKTKSKVLNIDYLNTHHGVKVVSLEVVVSILKDIELRLDDTRGRMCDDDDDSFGLVDNIYQDI